MIGEKKFSMSKFTIGNSVFALLNVGWIHLLLIPYIRSNGFNPISVSMIQSIETITFFSFLLLGGIFFDRFGARTTFAISRIADIIAIGLLLRPTFFNICVSVILFGISYGTLWGKYTSFIYNTLSYYGKLSKYPSSAIVFFFVWDIAVSLGAFCSSLLLKNSSYDMLIYVSLLIKIASLIVVFIIVPSGNSWEMLSFKSKSIKHIFISIYECAKSSKNFTLLLLFYGALNFFCWEMASAIGERILLDHQWSSSDVARYISILSSIMAIGTLIPIVILPQGISVKSCIIMSAIQVCVLFISALIYNVWLFIAIMCFTNATYSLLEVSIEKKFEYFSNSKIRGSVISVTLAIAMALKLFNIMLIGLVAQYHSYHLGFIMVVLPILMFMVYLCLQKDLLRI